MNIKLTAIVITIFLLLVPIAFADHARYATRSGNYDNFVTGAVAQAPSRVDQARNLQKQIAELEKKYDEQEKLERSLLPNDQPYYPSESLSNLADQIKALNAQLDSLWASLTTLELIRLWTTVPTPSNYNQCMKIEDLDCWDPYTQTWRYSITSIEPTPAPTQDQIKGGGGGDVIDPRITTVDIDYAGDVYEGPTIEPPYYIPTKTGSILYYPGTASNPTPTILEWNPATKTYELQKPASDVSTAGAVGPGIATVAKKTSIPPSAEVPYGADTVSEGTYTQEQVNQVVQTAVAAAIDGVNKGLAPFVIYMMAWMKQHGERTEVDYFKTLSYDFPQYDSDLPTGYGYGGSQFPQNVQNRRLPGEGLRRMPTAGAPGAVTPLGGTAFPTGGAGGAGGGAISGPQGIVPGGLGPEPEPEPPTGPGAAEAPKGCLVQYTGTGGYAAASLQCGCANDNACAGFCNSVAEARGERKHPSDITSCTCTPHESCVKR